MSSAPSVDIKEASVRNAPAAILAGYGDPPVVNLVWTDGYHFNHTRYGRKNTYPLYHVSDGVVTAAQEVFQGPKTSTATNYVPKESRVELLVMIDVPHILDLTDPNVLTALGVTIDEITETPNLLAFDPSSGRPDAYELTQCLGELAHACGFGGIRYPGARYEKGVNIAIFADHLERLGGWIETTNPVSHVIERLPKAP